MKKLDPIQSNEDLARLMLGRTLTRLVGPMLLYPMGARFRLMIELVMKTTIKLEQENHGQA